MAGLPAEIRIDTNTPFPALVTGANGVGIGKQNGIWQVGLNTSSLNTGTPPLANFAQDYVVVWDSIAGNYMKVSLATISSGAPGAAGGAPGQIQFNNAGALDGFTMSGDATVATGGALTIANNAVTTAKINTNAVTNAKLAQMPGLRLKGNNTGSTANANDLTVAQVNAMLGIVAQPPIPGQLSGLTLAPDATLGGLDIAIGGATSDDGSTAMIISTPWIKAVSAPFATGNGLSFGAVGPSTTWGPNAWFHVFLIYNPSGLNSDIMVSSNATSPTLPSGYTKKRRIGSIRTNASSQIIGFTQIGDHFSWAVQQTWDAGANNIGLGTFSSPTTISLTQVPPGVRVVAIINAYAQGGSWAAASWVDVESIGAASGTPTLVVANAGQSGGTQYQVMTNTSAQVIAYTGAATPNGFFAACPAWIDARGK
jgi:hypothetical protein